MLPRSAASALCLVAVAATAWGDCISKTNGPSFILSLRSPTGSSFQQIYSIPIFSSPGEWYYEDVYIQATVRELSPGQYELNVKNISPVFGFQIDAVWFPFDVNECPVGESNSDDIAFIPFLAGVAFKADTAEPFSWWAAGSYPGSAFSPIVIVADKERARITIATDDPPKPVVPMWSLNRQTLLYNNTSIPAGQSGVYRMLRREFVGSEADGAPPWLVAAQYYKTRLRERLAAEGLWPAPAPEWMTKMHGFYNISLHDLKANGWKQQLEIFKQYKDAFPWILMWGQMSCHFTDPAPLGQWPACYACCALNKSMHERYLEPSFDLLGAVQELADEGIKIGYYSRPWTGYKLNEPLPLPGQPTNLEWWRDWLDRCESEWYASSYYHDTVGFLNLGSPLELAHLYLEPRFQNSMVEGLSDLLPTASLVSGALHYYSNSNGEGIPGGPEYTWDQLGEPIGGVPGADLLTTVPFPQLGAYILSDRLVFNGQSNSGWQVWGSSTQHWAERQSFLLGWRFDVQSTGIFAGGGGQENAALMKIIELRNEVNWFSRMPEYADRAGITSVPDGIDVRRFIDRNGDTLLAVDNWSQVLGASILVDGQPVSIPGDRLSLLDLSDNASAVCAPDISGDGIVNDTDLGQMLDAFGKCAGDLNWNPAANIAASGDSATCVDGSDLGLLLASFNVVCERARPFMP